VAARKPKANALDKGETIVAERTDDEGNHIAVTSEGRKVILDGEGVKTRLSGPAYAWEASESADEPEAEPEAEATSEPTE
jgi:hypothetical protein